jgi:3-hydroxyisobutyrate dehydrogenase-like beta-hydroxyacid dehydrogenase
MVAGRYAGPESRVRQHRKDVAIIERYAQAAGQRLPLTEAHRELLDAAIAAGDGDLDNAAIFRRYGPP